MRKGVGVMAGAVLFGLLSGAARGLGGESSGASFYVWSTVANLSAPWLLIPFLAGSTATRPLRGALMGLVSTVTALLAFYSAVAMVSPLDGRTGAGAALSWVLANQVYFRAGLLTGPLLGAVGTVWQRRSLRPGRSRVSAGWLAALLLAGEPVVLLALGYAGPLSQSWRSELPSLLSLPLMWGLTLHRPTATLLVYGGELIAGLALLSLLVRRRQKALHSLR